MDNKRGEIAYWTLPIPELLAQLNSSKQGLTSHDARERIAEFGHNEVGGKGHRHGLKIFFSQFKGPLVLILIAAAILSFFLKEEVDAIVILAIVFLNSFLGFFQEYRAERTLRALSKYISHKAKVLRDGEIIEIDIKEVVPGDIVRLDIGDIIPADIRLLNVDELVTDESALTGESLPVIKKAITISEKHSIPQYLKNIAFMGTTVSGGYGTGLVIATGKKTFFGKTADLTNQGTREADFQKSVHKFGNFLIKVVLVMTVFIFATNALLGKGVLGSFLFAIALAVGITPEVLPVIMTLALSSGSLKMAKENVVTKRLSSVEDLGNIDILCCDKTGTLTDDVLTLKGYRSLDGAKDKKLLLYGLICNSERAEMGKEKEGNPIDKALWKCKEASALSKEIQAYVVVDENEFDYTRRRMSVVVKGNKTNTFIAKGAPESMLKVSTYAFIKGKKHILTSSLLASINKTIMGYEQDGYTVLAVAEKQTHKSNTKSTDEKGLTMLGFLLFLDPPRKSAKESLELLHKLGVKVKVLSGDNPLITRKICTEVNLTIVEDKVITSDDIARLSKDKLKEICLRYNVFARVTPEQKYKIVMLLKEAGHVVGFLGDGINDVPALKAADVGISVHSAIGIAKEAADIILLKKSLKVLADGIIIGRKTFANITKYILNTISANYGNMFTVVVSSLFLKFIPLLPTQILLINFISDGPLLTVSTDNVDAEFLKKPKRWDMNLIFKFMIYFGLISFIFDLALIFPLIFVFKANPDLLRTSWFVLSIITEIIITFAIRTRFAFFKSRPSKWLLLASLAAIIVTIVLPFTFFGNTLFKLIPIPGTILLFIGAILIAYFVTVEIIKRPFFKRFEAA